MLKLVQLLMKKPQKKTIRMVKITFWGIFLIAVAYNFLYLNKELNTFSVAGYTVPSDVLIYTGLVTGVIGLLLGAFDVYLLKSKYTRIIQILLGIDFFVFASLIPSSPRLDIDIILILLGIFTILAGITGKLISEKGKRTGQKVTKIRV